MKIIVAILGIICVPIYAVCVLLLIALSPIFGGYINASVYVCEYFQPIITILAALLFLFYDIQQIHSAFICDYHLKVAALVVVALIFLAIIGICGWQLYDRLITYQGLNNREIFNFVVMKLRNMGSPIEGELTFRQYKITMGYIVANFVVYILPMAVTLICGYIVRLIAHLK